LKDEESQEKLALFLLCGVSSVITNGDNVDLRAEDIYQLCRMCCETLEVENLTTNKYKFLCSLYHIIKYLVNKVMTGYYYHFTVYKEVFLGGQKYWQCLS
jgi:hypothetical protein